MSGLFLPPSLLPPRLLPSRLRGGGRPGPHRVAAGPSFSLGPAGSCPGRPTLLIDIFDDSGSVLGGNDSTGLRYAEAAVAFEAVARRCRCDDELAAILHMDRPNSADLPPTSLNRRNRSSFKAGLTVPGDGDGASTLRATLRRAEQLAVDYPDHDISLAVFSDFELFDDDLPGLWEELGAFRGRVFAVALRAAPPAALVAHDRITVTEITLGAAPGAVAQALFAALTTYRLAVGRRLTVLH
jgi:hypothetical protein